MVRTTEAVLEPATYKSHVRCLTDSATTPSNCVCVYVSVCVRSVTGEIFSTDGRDEDAKGAASVQRKEDSASRGPAENLQSIDDNAECQLKRPPRPSPHLLHQTSPNLLTY